VKRREKIFLRRKKKKVVHVDVDDLMLSCREGSVLRAQQPRFPSPSKQKEAAQMPSKTEVAEVQKLILRYIFVRLVFFKIKFFLIKLMSVCFCFCF
jgi:hypothetical protein